MADHPRLAALDWLRGLVMSLMTIDHASEVFNAGRLFTDSVAMYRPGTPLPAAQFFTRWITHLCAPTFVFLAGAALALSMARQLREGTPGRAIDGFLLRRGLLLILLEPLWMSWVFTPGAVLFQVLYAIGGGMMCMTLLRRLGQRTLLCLGLGLVLGGEALAGLSLWLGQGTHAPLPLGLLATGGRYGRLFVAYPLLPWLAIMVLGFASGRRLARGPVSPPHVAGAALLSLLVFVVVRGLNSYGNMMLLRDDLSLVQWLHVSKYPPSLTFTTLTLGITGLLLAAFLALERGHRRGPGLRLLQLLGQTALFFYLLHVHVMEVTAHLLGIKQRYGLGATYLATVIVLAALAPLCAAYRSHKRAHPESWVRYI